MQRFEEKTLTESTLVALLRYGLFGGEMPLAMSRMSDSDWLDVFVSSRQQAVTALTYDALLKLPVGMRPPRKVLFHFVSIVQTIEEDNANRERALVEFAALIDKEFSAPTVVVKGSSLAGYYPVPGHRECGDNDLYTGTRTDDIEKYMRDRGYEIDNEDVRHAAFRFGGKMFECHRLLLYHNDDPQWSSVPLRDGLMHLPAEEEAFFVAKHIEHHAVFFNEPVRLRDLIDWSMLLASENFDQNRLDELKRGTDVEHFADLMTAYCNELFGIGIKCGAANGLSPQVFERLYMQCPERHRLAIVRVARRSWKYLRYGREYRKIYGQSMFRRFYINNVINAIRNRMTQ